MTQPNKDIGRQDDGQTKIHTFKKLQLVTR